mmetsp:Transcript_16657/g.38549  ORF Transcript_16657/g.38549 Transcript_16657/m.38549 type:complete len:233 (-) Transcript_16657:1547-2245(-)
MLVEKLKFHLGSLVNPTSRPGLFLCLFGTGRGAFFGDGLPEPARQRADRAWEELAHGFGRLPRDHHRQLPPHEPACLRSRGGVRAAQDRFEAQRRDDARTEGASRCHSAHDTNSPGQAVCDAGPLGRWASADDLLEDRHVRLGRRLPRHHLRARDQPLRPPQHHGYGGLLLHRTQIGRVHSGWFGGDRSAAADVVEGAAGLDQRRVRGAFFSRDVPQVYRIWGAGLLGRQLE